MEPVIVIVGPTASGKTKISIELAKLINGSIISADSMQIYKHMDIGTAKPDILEMDGIDHYLIDEVYPDEEFSVARYHEIAVKNIQQLIKEGKRVIISGGTGLYVNSLLYNIAYSETTVDWELRNNLQKEAEEKGVKALHERLSLVDPEAAASIHENNVKRVIRAIEVYEQTKMPISHHNKMSKIKPSPYNFIVFGLKWDRAQLYERINKRVDLMFEKGLVDEVRMLIKMGYNIKTIAMQAIGYKEVLCYLRGVCTYNETVEILKRATRNYAKRQVTWFKRIEGIEWIDMNNDMDINIAVGKILRHVASFGII